MLVAFTLMLAAVIVEAGLAACRIVRRSNLARAQNIIWIGAFAVFLVAASLGVLEWGTRYLLLATVLLVRAAVAAVHLIRSPEDEGSGAFRVGRAIRTAILTTLMLWVAAFPAVLFPQHPTIETTGKFLVSTVSTTWVDEARIETFKATGEHRKVNVQFWYPVGAHGSYPLIVFSHGAFGVRTSNETLFNELASHGYVVASIDHTYHSLYTTDDDGRQTWIDLGFMRELSAENARLDREQSYRDYQKWMAVRTGDISFVIDRVSARAKADDSHSFFTHVDMEQIGVMGHSLGGSAALGIGRSRDDVRAVVALESPLLLDIEGVRDGEFVLTPDAYPVPVLNVYSDMGWKLLADAPQYAANHALLSDAAATAFNVHIQGVGHLDLTDLALTSPLLTWMLDQGVSATDSVSTLKFINSLCLTFFDRFLKGTGEFNPAVVQ